MPESPWLDNEQQRAWRAFLAVQARLPAALDAQLQRDAGIPHGYYEILVRLSEAPQRRLRMAELAASAIQSRSRLTHTVARMESKGLVSRAECPSDKRGVYAALTEAGFATLTRAAADHVSAVRELFVDVIDPDDFVALGRAFRAIGERLG